MSMINVENLTFAYDTSYDNIFENVSFKIDSDWKIGLVGRNGKGKTTLLKLIKGEYEYKGKILSNINFDYFPFEISNKNESTLNIIEKIYTDYELWKVCRELNLLNIESDILFQNFNTLSGGERVKVMLAVLFSKDNNFLLIDEPTNHLDMEGRKKLGEYLSKKEGYIVVSHDRYFLDKCIDHVIALNNSGIYVQKGNFSSWYENMEYKNQYELKENDKLKKEIKHLEKASQKTKSWSDAKEKSKTTACDSGFVGHKAAKMMKRALNIQNRQYKAIEEKKKLLKDNEKKENLKIKILEHHSQELIKIDNLYIQNDNRTILDNISFSVEKNERVALIGKNGSGKTSIFKALTGENSIAKGHIKKVLGLSISYVSQDTGFLKGSYKNFVYEYGIDESLFKAILRKLGFSRIHFEKNLENLSEGQKKKILIAKSLSCPANIYIWDEPLNYVDIISRIQIEELILKYKPTMLFSEHDKAFVYSVASKIVQI